MICTLSPSQIENLYIYVSKSLKENDNLDVDAFIKQLYKDISAKSNPETAVKFLQHVPRLIERISTDKNLVPNVSKLPNGSLGQLRQSFLNETKGLENIISYFEPGKDFTNIVNNIIISQKNEEEPEIDAEKPIKIVDVEPTYFLPLLPSSTTWTIFEEVDPEKIKTGEAENKLDPQRVRMQNVFLEINDVVLESVDNNPIINYKGRQIKLVATLLDVLSRTGNVQYIDDQTQEFINNSSIKQASKKNFGKLNSKEVPVKERVVLTFVDAVTNDFIVFDENNIPYTVGEAPADSKSLFAFQYLRNVQQDLETYNFYAGKSGKVEKALMADAGLVAERFGIDVKEAEKLIKAEAKKVLDLKEKVRNTRNKIVPLILTGVTSGINNRESAYGTYLKNILQVDPNFTLRNIKEEDAYHNEGESLINLNNSEYTLERVHLPNNIAQQIVDVLFNKELDAVTKQSFVNQFIPKNTKQSYFKFGIPTDTKKGLILTLFDKLTKEKNAKPIRTIQFNNLKDDEINNQKQAVLEALTTAWNGKGMPLAYRPDLILSGYFEYDGKNLVTKDYREFIIEQNPVLLLSNLEKGVNNKHLTFDFVSEKQQSEVETQLTQEEISKQLRESLGLNTPKELTELEKLTKEYTEKKNNLEKLLSKADAPRHINNLKQSLQDLENKFNEDVQALQNPVETPTEEETTKYTEDNTTKEEENADFDNQVNPSESTPIDINNLEDLDRANYPEDIVTQEQIDAANDFWNNTEFGKMLQKHITLKHATNIANSNVFAKFFISGATLANPNNIGTIAINAYKGSMVDLYHEAWHAFSQLYLSKAEKTNLYNEVKNFKDKNGKEPYKNLSFFEIEELIAEDFRTYMKSQYRKDNRPKRNSIFRKIWNFLKSLFTKVNTVNINSNSELMEVPVIKEWFEKLNFKSNDSKVFKDYSALVENSMFSQLNRGISDMYNSKFTVLSGQDSDLISNSIDMIISEYIDKVTDKRLLSGADPVNLQSTVLGLILNVKNRSETYKHVKQRLENKLKELTDQYQKQTNIKMFSSFKTKQNIIDNSVAQILTEGNKDNKYVFLKSQIDKFENLIPDIKRGDRVKGQDWHGIRIVGDYYDFIDENNKRVGIIVVSDPKDAVIQYNNYKKGGAQKYTGVKVKETTLPILTEEQEVLLDNIKILQMAVDNFGDPEWEIKKEKPTGVIAYHLQNSSYDLKNKQFEVDELDSEGNEIDEDTAAQTKEGTIDNDLQKNKKNILQLASKEVVYVINSLPKFEGKTIKTNKLGFREKGDFKKVSGILIKTIGGIRDRELAYKKLQEVAKIYPEIDYLMKYKYPNPKPTNDFAVRLGISFFKTFSVPKVEFKQLTIFKENQRGESEVTYRVTNSSLEINSVIKKFIAYFNSSSKSKLVNKTEDNNSILKLEEFVKEFKDGKGYFNQTKILPFLKTIGVKLDETVEINKLVEDPKFSETYGISRMYNVAKAFYKLSEKPESDLTQEQTKYLEAFVNNPVLVFNNPIPKGVLDNTVIDYSGNIKRLAELQIRYGFESANPGVLLPDGNKVFENVNHSLISTVITDLNNIEKLSDLGTPKYEHLSFILNSYAFVVKVGDEYIYRSKLLSNLFDNKGNRKPDKSLDFIFTAGTQIADVTGVNTSNLDIIGRGFQEFHTMLLSAVSELTRAAEKKSALGVSINGKIDKIVYNNIIQNESPDLWVPINSFNIFNNKDYSNGERIAVGHYLMPHLAAEFDRIREVSNNKSTYQKVSGYNIPLPNGRMSGESFAVFEKMLSENTKNDLYSLASVAKSSLEDLLVNGNETDIKVEGKTINTGVLRQTIFLDIFKYFNTRVDNYIKLHLDDFPQIAPQLYEKLGVTKENLDSADKKKLNQILVKAYLYNSMISKIETFNLFTGDLAQYDHKKEEASKRIPGAGSDGIIALNDQAAFDFVNDKNPGKFNSNTYATKLMKQNPDLNIEPLHFTNKIQTAVIADAVRTSIYLPEIKAAFEEDYAKDGRFTKAEIEKLVEKDIKAYKDIKESDGAAYLTFDTYRALKYLMNDWSPIQEQLYQDIINGENVSVKEFNTFFPVSKLHYYGPLENEEYKKLNLRAMHKFAVAPINPMIAKPGTALYDLHTYMMQNNIGYLMFGSGSKASTITFDGKSHKQFDNIFKDPTQQEVDKNAEFAPNVIYLNYLKEVTAIAAKFKSKVTVPTQKRVLVLDALFNAGILKNTNNKEIVDTYINTINDYTKLLKEELLDEIGFKQNEDGRYTGKLKDFVKMVRQELELKDMPEHLIKLLDVDLSDQLVTDFSIHPESDMIEKVIVNRIQKSLIKQKTKGEALVQMPTTFVKSAWDNSVSLTDNIKTNEDLILKYVGTNGLPFYKRGELLPDGTRAKTSLMKVAIALQGDFKNLLNLPDPANSENTIGTIDRLNELIKNPDWLKENNDKITIAGPRIPTDAVNSIEAAEVWHFFDESFGNSVIVPTEIVAKAGSDFDADKIFFMFPNINSDGTLPVKVETTEKLTSAQIQQQKKYLQNKLVSNTKAIIELPDNYVSLVKPNEMYLVQDHVDFFRDAAVYSPKEKIHDKTKESSEREEYKIMPATTALEEEYNLNKFEQNLSGNTPLGILAKKNKWHTLMKTIGAILPKQYSVPVKLKRTKEKPNFIKYDMRFRLPVNQTSKGNVSISNEFNVDKIKIGDAFSHALQGVLDRAKDPWPFLVQIVTEALPVMNRYLEAGASIPSVLKLMKSPLVDLYIRKQVYNNSPVAEIVRQKLSKSQVKKQSLAEILNVFFKQLEPSVTQELINEVAIAKIKELKEVLKTNGNLKLEVTNSKGTTEISASDFVNSRANLEDIRFIKTTDGFELYTKNTTIEGNKNFLIDKNNYYHAAEVVWQKAFEKGDATEEELEKLITDKDTTSLKSLAVLLHIVQAEKQFSGMDSLEMAYNPDTAIVDTSLEVIKRQNDLDKLKKLSSIDKDTLDRLLEKSILSSFYQNELILDLVYSVFPVKLHSTVTTYLLDKITMNAEISKVFGAGVKGQGRFISAFNNGLINYIYQNYKSSLTDENFNIKAIPDDISGLDVVSSNEFPQDIILEDNKIKVNLDKIQEDYNNLRFTKDTTRDVFKASQIPFKNVNEYITYLIHKEYLRNTFPMNTLDSNVRYQIHLENNDNNPEKAYEVFLSEKSLMKSFNRAYIMGHTKYKYTDLVLEVINTEKYKLREKYPVLANLSKSNTVKTGSILQLDDKALAKGDIAMDYYQNLRQLGDPSVKKVNNPNDNAYISSVFSNFSLFMYYQHGVGYSPLGFNKILDPEAFIDFMKRASNNFVKNNLNETTLDKIEITLDGIYKVIMSKERFKDFLPSETNPQVLQEKDMGELIETVDNIGISDEMFEMLEQTDSLGNLADTPQYKEFLARRNQQNQPSTQPTEVKGINISTKSSDKLGRELTNPNWGAKYIMDIEAEYKANASRIKAPELNIEEALKYDMNLMYKLQMKKFKAHPELVQEITNRGGVKFLEASEHTVGVKGSRWEGKGTNSNFIKVLIKSYQDSLKATAPTTQPTQVKSLVLKDGLEYGAEEINALMLEDMGYTPKEAGEILKSIC
jgi:hypothetical protein